jgi:hypothetical protein
MRALAKNDLLTSRDLVGSEVAAEFRQMVAGGLLEATVELAFLLRPDARNDLDDMEQRDRSRAFGGQADGDVQGWLVAIGQIDWHQDLPEHATYPLLL